MEGLRWSPSSRTGEELATDVYLWLIRYGPSLEHTTMNTQTEQTERFTLGDFMAVIACYAAAIAALLAFDRRNPGRHLPAIEVNFIAITSPVLGALLAGPVLFALKRAHAKQVPISSGEILWITNAIVFWLPVCFGVARTYTKNDAFLRGTNQLGLLWAGFIFLPSQLLNVFLVPKLLFASLHRNRDPSDHHWRHWAGLVVCSAVLLLDVAFFVWVFGIRWV